MKVIRGGVFFLSLLIVGLCHAGDLDDGILKSDKPRYSFPQIVREVKEISSDSAYVKDDLLIDRLLCLMVRDNNSDILQLLEAEINKINNIFENEKPKLLQNWSIKRYSDGSILTRRAPVKVRRI